MRRTLIVLAVLVLALPGLARAGITRLEGTVDSVDANGGILTLTGPQGWQRVWVQNATDIVRDGNRVGLWQIRPGDRVTVEGVPMNDGRLLAGSIRIASGGGGGGGGGGGTGSGSVTSRTPAPGSRVGNARPTVSATFSDSVSRARIWVDNAEFTGQASLSGNTVSWTPDYNLDNGEHTVRVEGYGMFGTALKSNWSFEIAAGGSGPVQVANYAPGPGTYVTVQQPTISASFTGPVNRRSIRLYVDGRDFTPQVQFSGNTVTWQPRYTLDYGQHTVRLEALTPHNQPVEGTWNFIITR